MQRRDFIKVVAGSAVVWPFAARAQQDGRVRRVVVLLAAAADNPDFQTWVGAFLQGLQQSGWSIGQNVQIDVRWAGAIPPAFANTLQSWPHSRRTSSWHTGRRL